jgi:activator of 2-hydroxyglutaryl-CoA dehydratase
VPDSRLIIGIDVGSTTDKVVVVDPASDALLWADYQRHEGKQLAKLLEMLRTVDDRVDGVRDPGTRVFVTGSGAGPLERVLRAKFVQEVNAVALAVERLHPEV